MNRISQKFQGGAVLLTSLMVLVVLTLLVVSMLRSNVLQLRIGGASQVAAEVAANADAAIAAFMNIEANRGQFRPGAQLELNLCSGGINCSNPNNAFLANVTLQANQLACQPDAGIVYGETHARHMLGQGLSPDAIYFDIRAEAQDTVFNGRAVVHQGVKAVLGPGTCPM